MTFVHAQPVLFKHCDPAGLVFYPRFFEMINDCIEAFFAHLGLPFARLHETNAIPTAEITTRFAAPSRLGDELLLELACTRIGRTSLGYRIRAACAGAERFTARATLVFTDRAGRPVPWPETLREGFARHAETEETT